MSLKSNKSPGIDYIPAEFLKAGVDIISNHVAELFNYVIENRDFPENWAIGLLIPYTNQASRLIHLITAE